MQARRLPLWEHSHGAGRRRGLWNQSSIAEFFPASSPGTHLLSPQPHHRCFLKPLPLDAAFAEPGASVHSPSILLSPEQPAAWRRCYLRCTLKTLRLKAVASPRSSSSAGPQPDLADSWSGEGACRTLFSLLCLRDCKPLSRGSGLNYL